MNGLIVDASKRSVQIAYRILAEGMLDVGIMEYDLGQQPVARPVRLIDLR